MLRLLGIPISEDDARHLVATLLVEGTADALTGFAEGNIFGMFRSAFSRLR